MLMTFMNVVSLIGTLVAIAVAVAGLVTSIREKNPTRKHIAQVSGAIGIVLVCVIIFAERV